MNNRQQKKDKAKQALDWDLNAHDPLLVNFSEIDHIRHLHFGTPWVQGSMDLKDPYALVLEYVQRMMAWLLLLPDASYRNLNNKKALQLGLGAGSCTKFCYKKLKMHTTVFELNAQVLQACQRWFKLPKNTSAIDIYVGDAQNLIQKEQWLRWFDVLQADLYDAQAAAPVLNDAQFYAHCKAALNSEGILSVNLFGRSMQYAQSLEKIVQTFGEGCVYVFYPTREGNSIVLAHNEGLQVLSEEDWAIRAAQIEHDYGIPTQRWLTQLHAYQAH